jgi:hypothetical protein
VKVQQTHTRQLFLAITTDHVRQLTKDELHVVVNSGLPSLTIVLWTGKSAIYTYGPATTDVATASDVKQRTPRVCEKTSPSLAVVLCTGEATASAPEPAISDVTIASNVKQRNPRVCEGARPFLTVVSWTGKLQQVYLNQLQPTITMLSDHVRYYVLGFRCL